MATLIAPITFWAGLENYFRLIIVIFGAHSLTPLETDLTETVEVYRNISTWLSYEVGPSLVLLISATGLATRLNLYINAGYPQLELALVSTIVLILGTAAAVLLWDTVLSGLHEFSKSVDPSVFYLQAKTTLTYDQAWGAADQFEWHKERVRPFVMRFEDMTVFFLQLFTT